MRLGKWTFTEWNRRNSNHIPVQLHSDQSNWGPMPFKAFDNWIKEDSVTSFLVRVNKGSVNSHWFGFLKEAKLELKNWSRKSTEDWGIKIKKLETLMKHLDYNSNKMKEKTKCSAS